MTMADYILLGLLVLLVFVGGFCIIRSTNESIKAEKAKYRFFTLASDEMERMQK